MLNPKIRRTIGTWATIGLLVLSGLSWAASTPILYAVLVGIAVTPLNWISDQYYHELAIIEKANTNNKKRK